MAASKHDQSGALSPAQQRAMNILANNPGITAGEFAELMWPDSPGWNRQVKSGTRSVAAGRGMCKAGGSYLGRLARRGLCYYSERLKGHCISELGETRRLANQDDLADEQRPSTRKAAGGTRGGQ